MNRIRQMYPHRPFKQLERWWGQVRKPYPPRVRRRGAVASGGTLYVVHLKKNREGSELRTSLLLETSSTECLLSYICLVLRSIYILHWIPGLRKPQKHFD